MIERHGPMSVVFCHIGSRDGRRWEGAARRVWSNYCPTAARSAKL